ncbi:hypothetical protein TGAM01_v201386 [Trichoderma gamsii]|uniref:Uncharacterized protein n=1 Tax=Trichoderma gamsii TaxID=398673 RepID=A0A2P5A0D9_9HYPO|nr:hypothetical protein TGAM01_v201386 [Trichoderma gamsii]PON30020.1 hypothetical protein TGAM01_v201386 [Trichoderma gamsii]
MSSNDEIDLIAGSSEIEDRIVDRGDATVGEARVSLTAFTGGQLDFAANRFDALPLFCVMREQTERNARTRSRDERVKFREGAASLFWRRFRGEARVPKQRRAAVVVQAVAVSLVSNSRFCTASDKEEVLTVSRRSVEAEARKSLDLAAGRAAMGNTGWRLWPLLARALFAVTTAG